mmetsp:Transcript_65253/g.206177  ORF Transcript_65253/g.206177 Transcript_65253/m.206177 type:complete len:322 (+) Transcript_65253:243-1208(+)
MVTSPKSFGKRERRSNRTFRKLSWTSFSFRAAPSTNTRKPRSLLEGLSKSTQFMNHPVSASISWKVVAFPRLPLLKVASAASVKSNFQVPLSAQSFGAAPPKPRQPRRGSGVGLSAASRSMAAAVAFRRASSSSLKSTFCEAKLSASRRDGPLFFPFFEPSATSARSMTSHISSCLARKASQASRRAALAPSLGSTACSTARSTASSTASAAAPAASSAGVSTTAAAPPAAPLASARPACCQPAPRRAPARGCGASGCPANAARSTCRKTTGMASRAAATSAAGAAGRRMRRAPTIGPAARAGCLGLGHCMAGRLAGTRVR